MILIVFEVLYQTNYECSKCVYYIFKNVIFPSKISHQYHPIRSVSSIYFSEIFHDVSLPLICKRTLDPITCHRSLSLRGVTINSDLTDLVAERENFKFVANELFPYSALSFAFFTYLTIFV